MTWLRVLVQEEWPGGREEDLESICGFPFDVAKAIGVQGDGPYVVSLYRPQQQTKDIPQECVDEPVHKEVLVYAHGVGERRHDGPHLYVSPSFADEHGLSQGEFVHIRAVDGSVLSLDNVILVASSADALKEATENSAVRNQINDQFKEKLLSLSVVLSHGSTISLPSSFTHVSSSSKLQKELLHFRVLECQPFLQGLIVPTTNITILPPKELPPNPTTTTPTNTTNNNNNNNTNNLFVSSFILPTFNDTSLFRIGKFSASLPSSIAAPPSSLPPSKMNVALLTRPIEIPYSMNLDRDYQNEIGVTLNTLQKLHIFTGTMVELCLCCAEGEVPKRVVANIFAVDSSFPGHYQDYTLYLSPVLASNIGFDPAYWLSTPNGQATIDKIIAPPKWDKATTPSPSTPSQNPPQTPAISNQTSNKLGIQQNSISFPPTPFPAESYNVASRVTLSRVKGPTSYNRTDELRRYFKTPKLVKVGDLIAISIKHSMLEGENIDEEHYDEAQIIPAAPTVGSWESDYASVFSSTVFFRVTAITMRSEAYDLATNPLVWVVRGETTLEQRGSVPAMLPTLSRSYLAPHPFFSVSHPLSLDRELAGVPSVKNLLDILRPALYPMSHELGLSFAVLLAGVSGSGKETSVRQVADLLGANLVEIDCYDLVPGTHPSFSQVESALHSVLSAAMTSVPCVVVLRNLTFLDVVAQQQQQQQGGGGDKKGVDLIEIMEQLRQETREKHQLMLVGTVEKADKLSPALRAWFRHEMEVGPPDETAREIILSHSLATFGFHNPDQIQHLAKQTVSLFPRDLHSLVAHATLAAKKRVLKKIGRGGERDKSETNEEEEDKSTRNRSVVAAGVAISPADLDVALKVLQEHHATTIGAPKVPDVKWEDVGGLGEAKKEIMDTIQLPITYPWLFSSGITPRSGILLFGPPGTGKTLLAKAVATECKLNFLSVKGPELINMYVGESERNIREIFQKARDARPCVIFFDELDSLAPKRGQGADSGGVMDRIVSQFLTELNGLSKSQGLFVIGATNRPDLIDDALLIPGRFDRKVYLGISSSREEQVKVMKALTRKFNLGESVKLEEIAEQCSTTLTGADFYALCSDAFAVAMKEYISNYTTNKQSSSSSQQQNQNTQQEIELPKGEVKIIVEHRHFVTAVQRLKPSVSAKELNYYAKLQDQFRNKKGKT